LNTNQVISNASSLAISYASLGNFERTRFAVKVTPPSGCSSADTISVQFQQKAVAAILPNFPAEICLGESFSLTATGGDVFKWTSSDTEAKLNVTNLQNIKPSKSGTYTYTVEVSFAGSKLCKSTKATVTVKVNERPIAKLKQKTIRLCQESSVILDATDSTHTQNGGTNAIRYSWRSLSTNEIVGTSAKNLFTFANAKPQASFNPSFYEITVTDIRTGCTAKDTASITFVRKAQPIINKSVRTSICLGDSIRLTASQGDNYRWNTGKVGATIWVKPDSVGMFTYKVAARFDTLCTEGYDSIKIQVNPIPVVKANAVKEINICAGNSATLLATGGIRYEWLSGEKTAKIVVSPLKDTKYMVRTFNEFSCPSKYDTVLVKVTPKSQIPDKFVLCEGDSVVINALNPDASTKYLWNTKDSTASIRVNKAGKYSVTIKVKACEYTLNTEVIIRQRPKIALDTAAILCFAIGNELEQKPYRVHKHTIFGKLLNREAGEIYYYEWYYKNSNTIVDNGVVPNDNVIPLEISKLDTSYVLRVRTGTGKICDKFATIRIKTICDARVKVPTAFSPNEDNLNDFFAPVTSDLVGIRLMIFQRWGDIVYEKYINPAANEGWNGVFKENEGWDGTFGGSPAPIDTYQYALIYWSRNQKGELIETKTTGSLVLLRGVSR
jgi:gliding motility-associated-like protein